MNVVVLYFIVTFPCMYPFSNMYVFGSRMRLKHYIFLFNI